MQQDAQADSASPHTQRDVAVFDKVQHPPRAAGWGSSFIDRPLPAPDQYNPGSGRRHVAVAVASRNSVA